jgi:Spy/CpxP family protein refolding chaperone
MDQVQKELKLTEEQIGKVKAVSEKLRAEMSSQFAAAREIEDRAKRRAKTDELRDQLDRNAREQLGDTLSQEQMRRLFQIRMQVRPVVESLARQRVAERLKLTDDQKKKVADINKDTQAKQSELFAALRGASDERRTELFQKLRQARADADQQALAVLTAEQKTAFQEMQGAKIELPTSRGPR